MPLDSGEPLGAPTGEMAARAALSPIKQRILRPTDPEQALELGFMHTVLCQTCLPYRHPPPEVRSWERRNGDSLLLIKAGEVANFTTGHYDPVPLPAGPKARLVLIHLNAEALRQGSRIVEVEATMSAFMRSVLGFEANGRDVKTMKQQLAALSTATIRIATRLDAGQARQQHPTLIEDFTIWIPGDERQRVLWQPTITLSQQYWDSLRTHAVPLDLNHVRKLMHSALALDMYSWLSQRLCRVNSANGDFVPWSRLYEQFGLGFGRVRDFRNTFRDTLRLVLAVYDGARIEEEISSRGMPLGIRLMRSLPPIKKRG